MATLAVEATRVPRLGGRIGELAIGRGPLVIRAEGFLAHSPRALPELPPEALWPTILEGIDPRTADAPLLVIASSRLAPRSM